MAGPTELVRVHGNVRRGSGEKLAGATLVFDCRVPTDGGSLQVGGKRALTHTNDRGEFDVELPRVPELAIQVYTSWTAEGLVLTQVLEPSRLASELVLVVP